MSVTKRPSPVARRMMAAFFIVALLPALLVGVPAGGAAPVGAVPAGLSAADWAAIRAQLPAPNPPVQSDYLKASNAEAFDEFGSSVAVDGDIVVVGAPQESSSATGGPTDNSANSAGAAYVFVRSGATWSQQAYLKASNAQFFDEFGHSVDVDGDTVVVGAYSEDSNGTGGPSDNSASDAGAAYVFVRSGVTWSQQAYLKASNAETQDSFGSAVAVDGNIVVAGAYLESGNGTGGPTDNSAFSAGAAYVFVRSGATWTEQAYLKASNVEAGDNFGSAVAVDEDAAGGPTVVVGAYSEDSNGTGGPSDNSAFSAGAAYVFVRSGVTWSQQGYLKASNADQYDSFSSAVAVAGDTVVVGAYNERSNGTGGPSDNSAQLAGAAYIFVRNGATWSQQAYLKASNAEADDLFARAVAVDEDAAGDPTVVIGAYHEDGNGAGGPTNNTAPSAGAAYVFVNEPEPNTITIVKEATPADNTPFDFTESITSGVFSLSDPSDNSVTFSNVTPGTYTVTETGETGWTLDDITCDDTNSTGNTGTSTATINLEDGEAITCTFGNSRDIGTIRIVKEATPADNTPFSFTEDIPGAGSGFTLSDPGDNTETFNNVPTGSYSVAENVTAGWGLADLVCDDDNSTGYVDTATAAINLEKGETVTCTFTNDKLAGTIVIVKEATPADDTVFNFTEDIPGATNGFTLSDPGDNTETFSEVPLGNYQVSESVPTGWSLDDISCTDPDGGSSADSPTAYIDLDLNETVTCTFSNSQLPPALAGIYVSAVSAGMTGDGLAFGPHDILLWDNNAWSKWFDGSAALLKPNGNAMHNINALWIPDTAGDDVVLAFAQDARAVPGISGKVDGTDLVWWNGSAFSLWFDGQDVGLSVLTKEKIDALHVLDGSESPIGGNCQYYLLISTAGDGQVPNHSGGVLKFDGTDVLGFCLTNSGATTAGFWHRVLNGKAEGMPGQALVNLSASDDGQVLYLTTKGTFNADSAHGGHSVIYRYDMSSGQFSGPYWSALANGLNRLLDGLQVDGELP